MYKQLIRNIARESNFPVLAYGDDSFILKDQLIQNLRTLSYIEQWKTLIDNKFFHIRMSDHSLFLFGEGERPSFSYIQCPLEIITFCEYLTSIGLENTPPNRKEHETDYWYVLETASERKHVTPIRFDYDERGYKTGVHPAAHLHIGLQNQIRLHSNKMTPLSFVLFVMRQMYPECWTNLIYRSDEKVLSNIIRSEKTKVNQKFLQNLDAIELRCT
ncbi:DUF2290 domain-containing protein [Xanthomonas sp. WHRI 7065]|uniref:DUF2290 domain-containing protein n=1 Tax=Xanthomonas sp. WHRI 7065 TaxID=3161569 RepID=UPI0035A962C4